MNIADVAKRANVSTATVSRVMSGSDAVRGATRAQVLKVIDALGYVPNSNARSLSRGRSGLLGMIISDMRNSFFPELVQTFTELAERKNLGAIVSHTNYDEARMQRSIRRMLEQKVEGVAIMTSEWSEQSVQQLVRRKIPTVLLDASDSTMAATFNPIKVDYENGIREALDHLIGLGHKRIAFLSGPPELRSAAWRKAAFIKLLAERGLELDRKLLAQGNHRVDGGYRAMKELLRLRNRPTAVLGSNDLTAIGAIAAINEEGIQVPADVSVIGYDDIEISSAYNPPLTTVSLSRIEIATRAFDNLYASMHPEAGKIMTSPVTTKLIVRKSTSVPPRTKGRTGRGD